ALAVDLARAVRAIVARRPRAHQVNHAPRPLSDGAVAALARVSQSYWARVRQGEASVGLRLISGLAVSMPELLRAAIEEIQQLRRSELERGDAAPPAIAAR